MTENSLLPIRDRSFDDVSTDLPSADEAKEQAISETLSHVPFLARAIGNDSDAVHFWSVVGGLMGLGVAVFLGGILLAFELDWLDSVIGIRRIFSYQAISMQAAVLPVASIAASLITLTLFWSRSVTLGMCIAVVMVSPGLFAFFVIDSMISRFTVSQRNGDVGAMLFAFLLATALIGVIFQLWSRWTLRPMRLNAPEPRRWGIRLLLELTATVAVIDVAAQSFATNDLTPEVIAFALMGVCLALAAIGMSIGVNGERKFKFLPVLFAFAMSSLAGASLVVPAALMEFAPLSVWTQQVTMAVVSMIGGAIACIPLISCAYWMRLCGWRCE